MINLSKEESEKKAAAEEEEDEEAVESQLQALREHREAVAKPVKWAKDSQVYTDLQHTFEKLNIIVS